MCWVVSFLVSSVSSFGYYFIVDYCLQRFLLLIIHAIAALRLDDSKQVNCLTPLSVTR